MPAEVVVDPPHAHDVVFSPDGTQIATVHSSGMPILTIFDAATGDHVATRQLDGQHSTSLLGWGTRGILVHLQEDKDWRSWVERIDPARGGRGEVVIEASHGLDVWPIRVPAHYVDLLP